MTAHRRVRVGAAVACAATVTLAAACQPTIGDDQQMVAASLPASVTQKVGSAQSAWVGSVAGLADDVDRAACDAQNRVAGRRYTRQALAEARLDVADAVGRAASATTQPRGTTVGVSASANPRMTVIADAEPAAQTTSNRQRQTGSETMFSSPASRSGWSCLQATRHPECVHAAASDVAQVVYRDQLAPVDLNPVTLGDAMEAFGADMQWAAAHLSAADGGARSLAQLDKACRNGHSPLQGFFAAGARQDNLSVRRDLLLVRRRFVGHHATVCDALPGFYRRLLDELNARLGRRTRTGRCTSQVWEPLWD